MVNVFRNTGWQNFQLQIGTCYFTKHLQQDLPADADVAKTHGLKQKKISFK